MKRLLACLLIVAGFGISQASDMSVSLDDILLLSQRGVSDETILVFIQNREIGFVPDADDIDRLLEAGVSEEVIRYLLQKTASAPPTTYVSTPVYTYIPVSYVDTYPAYYYTPYYTRASLFFGFSTFPHTSFGHGHHGAVHHNRPHHTTSLQLAHKGHGVSHFVHSDRHGVTRAGGHGTVHSRTGGIGHSNRSVGHSRSAGIGHSNHSVGHSRSASIGHSRSGSFGHRGGHSSGGH